MKEFAKGQGGAGEIGRGDGSAAGDADAGKDEAVRGVEQAQCEFPGVIMLAEQFPFDEVTNAMMLGEVARRSFQNGGAAEHTRAGALHQDVTERTHDDATVVAVQGQDSDTGLAGSGTCDPIETNSEAAFADEAKVGRVTLARVVLAKTRAHAAFELADADIEAGIEVVGLAESFHAYKVLAGFRLRPADGPFTEPSNKLTELAGTRKGLALGDT